MSDTYLDASRGPLSSITDATARKEIGKLWDVIEGRLTRSGDQQLSTSADLAALERRVTAKIDALPQPKSPAALLTASVATSAPATAAVNLTDLQGAHIKLAGDAAELFGTATGQLRFYTNGTPLFGVEPQYLAYAPGGTTVFGCEASTRRPLFHVDAVDTEGYLGVIVLGLGARRIKLEAVVGGGVGTPPPPGGNTPPGSLPPPSAPPPSAGAPTTIIPLSQLADPSYYTSIGIDINHWIAEWNRIGTRYGAETQWKWAQGNAGGAGPHNLQQTLSNLIQAQHPEQWGTAALYVQWAEADNPAQMAWGAGL